MDWQLKEVSPQDIKNHPSSIQTYGTEPINEEMLKEVREAGRLREPPRVTKDMVLLSGHRRRQVAIAAKLKSITVLVCKRSLSEEEQHIEIVESNRHREKTMEQKAREFSLLAEARAKLNRRNSDANLKKGQKHREFPEEKNFSTRENITKSDTAADLGLSKPTAEKAAAVVEKIDELEEAGKTAEAEKLRETLNTKSVSAAAREAGVAKPPKKPSLATVTRDGKRTVAKPSFDADAIEKQFGALTRAIDDMARVCSLNNSPGHKQCVGHLSKAFDGFRAFVKECKAVQARKGA